MPELQSTARRSRRTFLKQAGLAVASSAFPSIIVPRPSEPVAVTGRLGSEREEMYGDVPKVATFELEFPGGVRVKGETSFGKSTNDLDVTCTDGWYRLRPFQTYVGVRGETSDGTRLPPARGDQQARQMDDDARAI